MMDLVKICLTHFVTKMLSKLYILQIQIVYLSQHEFCYQKKTHRNLTKYIVLQNIQHSRGGEHI